MHEEAEESNDIGGAPPSAAAQSYHTKNNCLCIAEPDKVDEILGVQHYIAAWPKIPIEELHASSEQHPHHPSMRWLLHSRRVPKHAVQSDSSPPSDDTKGLHEAERGVPPSMNTQRCAGVRKEALQEAERGVPPPVTTPRSAGVGKEDETVWACFYCARCLCQKRTEMQALALAN